MSEIKKEVLDKSARIQEGLVMDKDGVLKASDGLYASLLSGRVTVEQIEFLQEDNTEILAAAAHAVGVVGTKAMQKDENLQKVTLELPTVGKDNFNFTFSRSTMVRDGAVGDKDAGMKPKYGTMRVGVDTYASGSHGQMSAVKTFLSEDAALLLDPEYNKKKTKAAA
jgi:hypothetical protein